MSNWALFALCFAAFWLGCMLGFLTAAALAAAARSDEDSGGFH
jgi:F0F1-type ATP synthase membrane subunit c/vacuolar-type H+-ATPase subunit K